MFAKALEKVGKRLLDAVLKRPWGVTFAAMVAVIATTFLLLQHFQTAPASLEVARHPVFFGVACAVAIVGSTVLMRQAKAPRWLAYIILVGVVASAMALGWKLYHDTSRTFKIDLVFDSTVNPEATLLAEVVAAIQQPHIRVTLLSRELTPSDGIEPLVYADAEKAAVSQLRPPQLATHTILVTSRVLSNEGWSNLFYTIPGRFGILSTMGVGDASQGSDRPFLRRYLVALIPLMAIHADAHQRGVELLPDRSAETDHGCLLDFSKHRHLFLERLRMDTKLCDQEALRIESEFGPTILREYQAILKQAG